jgi:hypothetical protein
VLGHCKRIRSSQTDIEVMVHGWRLGWKLRAPTAGSRSRAIEGDLTAIAPSGEIFRSIIAIKRVLPDQPQPQPHAINLSRSRSIKAADWQPWWASEPGFVPPEGRAGAFITDTERRGADLRMWRSVEIWSHDLGQPGPRL